MKLKIDKLQELLDRIRKLPDYPDFYDTLKSGWKKIYSGFDLYRKGEDGIYTYIYYHLDAAFYLAQTIIDNIIPYYLTNIQTVATLYDLRHYDTIEDGDSGWYLGIPFFKLPHADMVYSRWHAHEHERLKNDFEHDTERLTEYLLNIKSDLKDKTQSLYEAEVKFKTASSPECRFGWACEMNKYDRTISELKKKIDDATESLNNSKEQYKIAVTALLNSKKQKIFTQQYQTIAKQFESAQQEKIEKHNNYRREYIENYAVAEFMGFILNDSFYPFEFECRPRIEYSEESKLLIVDYYLPTIDEIPNIKEIKTYKTKSDEIKYLSKTELNKLYDELIYKIIIRSVAEIFHFDDLKKVDTVCFNGRVESRNPATGQLMDNCILSVQINRQEFETIDLNYVDCKACFKHFKGVSGAKLHDQSPVVPLIQLDKTDKRFIESHNVAINESTNLATIEWGEFEHLVRELFDLEFNVNGGEVKITQASRDGGVDAVAFDPDPIRGGKIVIQAKRYTNTVGVSAVRDLYGTVINEGANKGILITTSDYGADSYNFAKGKPITLLNGGHLLFLLEKHNKKARIDLKEAK